CDLCGDNMSDPERGGASGMTASPGDPNFKWSLDISFDYRKAAHLNVQRAHEILDAGRDTHGHLYDFTPSLRLAYNVTKDLAVGVTQSYRYLRMRNIEGFENEDDPDAP